MTFRFIDWASGSFPVQRMCSGLGVSKCGYFAWRKRTPSRHDHENAFLLTHIRSAFSLSNGMYGSPRMTRMLQEEGFDVGRHRVARLMRESDLRARMEEALQAHDRQPSRVEVETSSDSRHPDVGQVAPVGL